MSGSEQYEQVSASSDGVTVDKRFEEDEFPVPAIAFEIDSSRSETVTIVLVDEVPGAVSVEDLGFHPEYGSEYWDITDNQITFEREIEPNSEYTTVYGIRATGTDDVEQFLTEPTIQSVDPPLDEEDSVVDEEGTDVVRDVIAGDSDTVPGLEEDEEETTEDEDEDVGTLDLSDPTAPGQERDDGDGETSSATADDTETHGGTAASGEVDSLVEALATELRNGAVDEDDVKLLRRAFDVVDDQSGSVDARIRRLQTEVSDLLAYTDALEEFLDENGSAQQTIEEFRSELEGVRSNLQEADELARSHEAALSEIQSTVEDVESSVESMESEMDAVLEDVDAVRSDVDAVQTDVDGVEGTVDEMEETVADVETSVESVEGTVDDLETNVETVEETVDDLKSQVGEIDVEDVRSDIDRIDEDIEDLKNWRDQLTSVIGGGGD